jgi:hypothetical protein
MTGTQERATAAMRAIGDTVTGAPPLRLPEPAPVPRRAWLTRLTRLSRPGGTSWRLWLAPAAAAVAVVAVAVSLVLVRSVPGGPAAGPGGVAPAATGAAGLAGVPAYYVAAASPTGWYAYAPPASGTGELIIGSTATGQRLSTVKAPPGLTFNMVTGAADDRTFVVGATSLSSAKQSARASWSESWYLLRIYDGARIVQLTRLPVAPVVNVTGAALSPDGTKLAVSFQLLAGSYPALKNAAAWLIVYSVPDGQVLHQWHTPRGQVTAGQASTTYRSAAFEPGALSTALRWTPDSRELGFAWNGLEIRLLNLAAAASRQPDLVKASTGQFRDGIGAPPAGGGFGCDLGGGWSLSAAPQVLTCAGRERPLAPQAVNVPGAGTQKVFSSSPPCPKSTPFHPAFVQERMEGGSSLLSHVVTEAAGCVSGSGAASLGWTSADGSAFIGQLTTQGGRDVQFGRYANGKLTRLPALAGNAALASVAW